MSHDSKIIKFPKQKKKKPSIRLFVICLLTILVISIGYRGIGNNKKNLYR